MLELNDWILKTARDLDILLINLKIQNTCLHENSGIEPIIDELQKIIDKLEIKTKDVASNRAREFEVFKEIEGAL